MSGFLKIKGKAIVSVVLISLTAVIISAGVGVYISRVTSEEAAIHLAREVAESNAKTVKTSIDSAFQTARSIAVSFASIRDTNNINRKTLDSILKDTLVSSPNLLGTWSIWEPNALDGEDAKFVNTPGHDATGRYLPYWYRANGEIGVAALEAYEELGDGDYYLLALNSGTEQLLAPYLYPVGGEDVLLTSIVVPVVKDGKSLGVGGVDIALSSIQKDLAAIKPLEEGYLTLISSAGMIVAHVDGDMVSKSVDEIGFSPEIMSALSKNEMIELSHETINGVPSFQVMVPMLFGKYSEPWGLVVTIPNSKIFQATNEMTETIFFLTLGLGVLVAFAAMLFGSSLSRPIVRMTDAMSELASGNLEAAIPAQDRSDEIGKMASAVQVFKDNAVESKRLAAETVQQQAAAEHEKEAQRARVVKREEDERTAVEKTYSRV